MEVTHLAVKKLMTEQKGMRRARTQIKTTQSLKGKVRPIHKKSVCRGKNQTSRMCSISPG